MILFSSPIQDKSFGICSSSCSLTEKEENPCHQGLRSKTFDHQATEDWKTYDLESWKFQIKLFRFDQGTYSRLDLSVVAYILVSPHYNYNNFLQNLLQLGAFGLVGGSYIAAVTSPIFKIQTCPPSISVSVLG